MNGRKCVRFSLRFLLGAVTLVCVYLATWSICKRRAISDVKRASGGWPPRIIVPFVLGVEKSDNVTVVATYHLWCFGPVLDLPYSFEHPETGGFVSDGVRPRIIFQEEDEQPLNLSHQR